MTPNAPPDACALNLVVEAAPIAILIQDLSAVWDGLDRLRAEGVSDLRVHLDARPSVEADLLAGLRGVWANSRACALLGAETGNDPTPALRRFLNHPENRDFVRDSLLALWNGETRFQGEGVGTDDTGRTLSLGVTLVLPASPDEARSVPIYVLDRSEVAGHAEALRASETRFRLTFERASLGMAITALDGRVRTTNPAFSEIVGLSDEDLIGMKIGDLTSEGDHAEGQRVRATLLADPAKTSQTYDKRLRHADGRTLWVRATATLVRTTVGEPWYFIYQIQNLTEHQQAIARARAAENQLFNAIESVSEDVLLFDPDDRLVLVNSHVLTSEPDLAKVLIPGATFEDISRRIAERKLTTPEGDVDQEDWLHWRLARFRKSNVEPFETRSTNGRWFLVRQSRGADGSTLILRSDITDMKRREADLTEAKRLADRANRAKSAFLANMSHELRTPLNAINGFAEVMVKELHGPLGATPYADYVNNILSAGQHLLDLISDILDISVVEAGDLLLAESDYCPASLVSACLQDHVKQAADKGLVLRNAVPAGLPLLRCDAYRIRQVLQNLLSNAIKFTPPDGTVEIGGCVSVSGGLIITVCDTGIGMTGTDIQVALTNFGQVQNVFARSEGGTGLGLPLARALIEAHGGHLSISSAPDRGTTVTLDLPAWRVLRDTEDAGPIRALRSTFGDASGDLQAS
ncbi:PAS domain-containing sensor histidine kinase [Rhodospira trueperi]|uniref:histidine kinase n=1 Tax=Rhodospira trueperi TaxID=69960 RepID=A0A1G6WA48_9PROT|nr:ATP-binding protein [Rhodospira trueperi]SDD62674.1 two-component system, cell cycle sensor histidine kinase PleC [Rhodospira trueperi]